MSKVLKDLGRRLSKLERDAVRMRQGVMEGPDAVLIAGADVSKDPVRVIGGDAAADDRVTVLTTGKDGVALNSGPFIGPSSVALTNLDGDVLSALDDPHLTQKRIFEAMNYIGVASGTVATGDYVAHRDSGVMPVAGGISAWPGKFAWDPDEHFPGARTVRMRLEQHLRMTNATSPGVSRTWQAGLWVATTTDALSTGLGSLVTDSRPSTQTLSNGMKIGLYPSGSGSHSAEFDAPAACLLIAGGSVAGGTIATNCFMEVLTRIVAWEE